MGYRRVMRTDGCAQARAIELQVGDHTHEALACGPEDGRLVLFLHGFPTTEAMWRPVLRELGLSRRDVPPKPVGLLEPTVAVPVHDDDYIVFTSPLADFRAAAEEAGVAVQIRYLAQGERYSFEL